MSVEVLKIEAQALLEKLGAHLVNIKVMNNMEMLALKMELLRLAEKTPHNIMFTLEEANRGNRMWAAVGRTLDGTIVVWHEPLPKDPILVDYLKYTQPR